MPHPARTKKSALSATDAKSLLAAVRKGPTLFARSPRGEIAWSLSGIDRSMLYALVLETGVSADEARQLTPNNFDLEADIPTLTLPATVAPRRRHLLFPLGGAMASMLGEFMLDRDFGSPVFNLPDTGTMDRVVGFDAKAAGVSAGTSITFASLTCVFAASLRGDSTEFGFRPWNEAAVEVLRSTDV